jgi:hypothetical protein
MQILAATLALLSPLLLPLDAIYADTFQLFPQLLDKTPDLGAKSMEVKKDKNGWQVSFCPDNTCNIIRAPSKTPREVIRDFTPLYLCYASGYVYLKQFALEDAKPFATEILARNKSRCIVSSEYGLASCVLLDLAKRHKISVSFSRAYEGAVLETPLILPNDLSEERIRQTKKWQKGEWKRYP